MLTLMVFGLAAPSMALHIFDKTQIDRGAIAARLQTTDEYTIQQKENMRYLDAHMASSEDYSVVTRPEQGDDSQKWVITTLGNGDFTIQQKQNMRYLDAHLVSSEDYSVVTRPEQGDDSQKWIITPVANGEYTIQQKQNMRYLDAHLVSSEDYSVVTREEQSDDSQKWVISPPLPPPTPSPTPSPTPTPPTPSPTPTPPTPPPTPSPTQPPTYPSEKIPGAPPVHPIDVANISTKKASDLEQILWSDCLKVGKGSKSGSVFRCGLGACIPAASMCNFYADCEDGSDESPELCGDRKCYVSGCITTLALSQMNSWAANMVSGGSWANCNTNNGLSPDVCIGTISLLTVKRTYGVHTSSSSELYCVPDVGPSSIGQPASCFCHQSAGGCNTGSAHRQAMSRPCNGKYDDGGRVVECGFYGQEPPEFDFN